MIKLKHILFEEDSTEKSSEKGEKEKKSTEQPVTKEKGLTPIDFVPQTERVEIVKAVKDIRPDLRNKVLGYDFTETFKEYDDAMVGVNSNKQETQQNSIETARKILKRVQAVSVAKHTILNTFKLDPETLQAAKEYRGNAKKINDLLRNKISFDKEEEKRLKGIISKLDTYFQSPDSKLGTETIVYRGVKNEMLPLFLKKKEWKDDAFTSTSLNPFISENFSEGETFTPHMRTPLFRIILEKGDSILMVPCSEDDFCGETEITLPRGCKFTLGDADVDTNVYTLNVEFPNA